MSDVPSDSDEVRVRFTDMAYGGDAVGRADEGIAVFGWPGIQGEEALVHVTTRRRNMLRGVVERVIEASPDRTEAPCPYFGACGGCQWQHITYAAQVRFKHDTVASQLQRGAAIETVAELMKEPIASPVPFAYRNTSHFAIEPQGRRLGYFRRASHTVIPVDHCPISNQDVNRAIGVLNGMLARATGTDESGEAGKGTMRVWSVAIRSSLTTGQTVVVLHSEAAGRAVPRSGSVAARRGARERTSDQRGERPDQGPVLDAGMAAHPTVSLRRRDIKRAVAELARSAESDLALRMVEVMDDGTVNLLGETRAVAQLTGETLADVTSGSVLSQSGVPGTQTGPPLGAWIERLKGVDYWVAPSAFFQVNTAAGELLITEVAQALPHKVDLLVDAHAGVGTFAIAFAGRAKRTLAFETDASAVASGQWTAATRHLSSIEYRHGRAETLLPRLHPSERPDVVLLDPPRSGCHPDLLAEIARRHVPRIIYISCDPSSLARDVRLLSAAYTLQSARVVDMFPQTYHMETVAVLDLSES